MRWYCGLLWGGLSFSGGVGAHPHSFIDLQTTFVVNQQQFTGLQMTWAMDELTSADLLYDAQEAGDASEVWKKLTAEVMANVLAAHYFTTLYRQGEAIKYQSLPTDYSLSRQGNKAVLRFTLLLAQPQSLSGATFQLSTFDPTYYVDMQYPNQAAVHLPMDMIDRCQVQLIAPKRNTALQAYARSLDKEDAPEKDWELGKQFAQEVRLTCQ